MIETCMNGQHQALCFHAGCPDHVDLLNWTYCPACTDVMTICLAVILRGSLKSSGKCWGLFVTIFEDDDTKLWWWIWRDFDTWHPICEPFKNWGKDQLNLPTNWCCRPLCNSEAPKLWAHQRRWQYLKRRLCSSALYLVLSLAFVQSIDTNVGASSDSPVRGSYYVGHMILTHSRLPRRSWLHHI